MHPLLQSILEVKRDFDAGKITAGEALGKQKEMLNSKCSAGLARKLTVREFANSYGDVAETALAYQASITTLTYVRKDLIRQKFFTVAPSEYMTVVAKEGSFAMTQLQRYQFIAGGSGEAGDIDQGGNNSKLMQIQVGTSPKTIYQMPWAAEVTYNIFEINQALFDGSFDIITELEGARKKVFDLYLQKVAFLGRFNDNARSHCRSA